MKSVSLLSVLNSVFLLLIASCVAYQYQGVHPISPIPARSWDAMTGLTAYKPAMVYSLQPTFSWNCLDSQETRYDIIIYKGVGKFAGEVFDSYYVRGAEVYYREGVQGCSHNIEQLLERNTVYVWAVRVHSGSYVGPWSTYDFQQGILPGKLFAQKSGTNIWCAFKTP